jgi:hypothetical protein
VKLAEHDPAEAFRGRVGVGERRERQPQMVGVVDDPLTPRDGLTADDGHQLQKRRNVLDRLGRRPLGADQMNFPALDRAFGSVVEQGSTRHRLEEIEADAKSP